MSTPGSYVFLSDPDDTSTVVTTYEALRDGTTTALLIHTSDADGASRADVYDAVEVGDLFEWHKADDCFVRYTVIEVKPDPAGAVPRKLLAVEWMTYAFTGCSGTIPASTVATVDWGELSDLGGTSLAAPVIHGTFQIAPEDWEGEVKSRLLIRPDEFSPERDADSMTAARSLDLWREPDLPEGWTFGWASSGGYGSHPYGYCATFLTEERTYQGRSGRYEGVEICGYHAGSRFNRWDAAWHEGAHIRETRVLAGRPALALYSPPGPRFDGLTAADVYIYDPATETEYSVLGKDTVLLDDVNVAIAIALSLFADAPPPAGATTFRYDTYDTTGAVSTPGSYVFLADPDDTFTVVTTYEALRDGTATALLIHTSDAGGASRADVYDTVVAGDLFEWHQADDCFVRYTVTEVKPDPTGTVPRKLLAVEWMTYAYSGCSGTISANANVGMTWSDLLDLGGVDLPAPVVHGTFHLEPPSWEGKAMVGTRHDPPDTSPALEETSVDTLAAARAQDFPYWREPSTMPEGWELSRAWEGGLDAPWYGFCSVYVTSPPGKVLQACGAFSTARRFAQDSSYRVSAGQNVRETRVIGGRPAMILWSPPGPEYVWYGDIHIRVFDRDTEGVYGFIYSVPKRSDSDANAILQEALDLVTSFFESAEEE